MKTSWGHAIPFQHVICHQTKLVTATSYGVCDLASSLAEMQALARDMAGYEAYAVLADFRDFSYFPGFHEIWQISDAFTELKGLSQYPLAMVFGAAKTHAIGSIFSVLANARGARARAFREMDQARAWLALQTSNCKPD